MEIKRFFQMYIDKTLRKLSPKQIGYLGEARSAEERKRGHLYSQMKDPLFNGKLMDDDLLWFREKSNQSNRKTRAFLMSHPANL